jgi:hypothetical protein
MARYDTTKAGCARYLAYEAEQGGNLSRAEAWRHESWRLWDGQSSLRFDPTGRTYYDMVELYDGMLWICQPLSEYDRIIMENDLYIIAMKYEMGPFLGVDLYTGELLPEETHQPPEFCECAMCEFSDPDVDLGYMLYCDPDYLRKRKELAA